MTDTAVKIGKTILKKPMLGASGCSGWGDELRKFNDFSKIGGFVTKSITYREKIGNEMPRIMETCGGLMNSIGLENKGAEYFIKEVLPSLKRIECAKFLNLAVFEGDELQKMMDMLEREDGFDGYEINISCPNVTHGGISFNSSLDEATKLLKGTRKMTERTLLLKLSPAFEASFEIARMAQEEGFDGITFTNTYIGTAVDVEKRSFIFKNRQAGLSGPSIKPLSLMNVYKMRKSVSIPVIGVGGITNLRDVLEFLIIGASAVQIGTQLLVEPDILTRLSGELDEYMNEKGIRSIVEIIGSIKE